MIVQLKFIPISRMEYMHELAKFGISHDDVEDTVRELTYKDYVSGPSEDYDNKGYYMWVFGKEICEIEMYIKLSDDFRGNVAKCISFHKPKYKLSYPYN